MNAVEKLCQSAHLSGFMPMHSMQPHALLSSSMIRRHASIFVRQIPGVVPKKHSSHFRGFLFQAQTHHATDDTLLKKRNGNFTLGRPAWRVSMIST